MGSILISKNDGRVLCKKTFITTMLYLEANSYSGLILKLTLLYWFTHLL